MTGSLDKHEEFKTRYDTLEIADFLDLEPTGTAPAHRDGRLALADGAGWDPNANGVELVQSIAGVWETVANHGSSTI